MDSPSSGDSRTRLDSLAIARVSAGNRKARFMQRENWFVENDR
jgi:hypothetical protein